MRGVRNGAKRILAAVAAVACLGVAAAQAGTPRAGELLFADGFDLPVESAGGVNYLWYDLGPGCDLDARDPYGLVTNYHLPGVRIQAQQQLATMHARGMRTLSLGVHFFHGANASGTLLDSSNAADVAQAASNLGVLLQDVHAAGFQRVLFRFFPQGAISPSNPAHGYSGADDPLLLEYWNLIVALRPVLASSGVPYRIDLMVEGAPRDDNSLICRNGGPCKPDDKDWSDAVRQLWRNYTQAYGAADTVGFSFLTSTNRARLRVRHMKYVYEGSYPDTFAMDFYGGDNETEADQFVVMAGLMDDYGANYGFAGAAWIISEAYYNDPFAAANLSSAIAATRQPVRYLTEWPLERGSSCDAITYPPPYEYDIWRMYGF